MFYNEDEETFEAEFVHELVDELLAELASSGDYLLD